MIDTADLTTAEVGDVLHLRHGGYEIITKVGRNYSHDDYPVKTNTGGANGGEHSWRLDGRRASDVNSGDCIRLEKRRPVTRPDPLIFGASVPGNEPVAVKAEEYEPLTALECAAIAAGSGITFNIAHIRSAHRAGWFKRRAP